MERLCHFNGSEAHALDMAVLMGATHIHSGLHPLLTHSLRACLLPTIMREVGEGTQGRNLGPQINSLFAFYLWLAWLVFAIY